jgi:hypothetical protein
MESFMLSEQLNDLGTDVDCVICRSVVLYLKLKNSSQVPSFKSL